MTRRNLLTLLAVTGASLGAAMLIAVIFTLTGLGNDEPVTTIENPPAPTPCAIPTEDHESSIVGSGPEIALDVNEACLGQRVRVTLSDWSAGAPVRIYLLTEEQFDLSGAHRRGADLVKLGDVQVRGAEASFDFALIESYKTEDERLLNVTPGQRLFVMAAQDGEGGSSHASRTGPLQVR